MVYQEWELRQFRNVLSRCVCKHKTFTAVKNTKDVDKYQSRSAINRLYEKSISILTDTPLASKQRISWGVYCNECGAKVSTHELKRDAVLFIKGMMWLSKTRGN